MLVETLTTVLTGRTWSHLLPWPDSEGSVEVVALLFDFAVEQYVPKLMARMRACFDSALERTLVAASYSKDSWALVLCDSS